MDDVKRLIVDVSSVVKTALYAGKDSENGKEVEFQGKKVWCNSAAYGYDCSINSLVSAMDNTGCAPSNMILVVETGNSKIRRQQIYKGYKESRGQHPELLNKAFDQARDMVIDALRNLGAIVVTQPHVEADDVIAFLVRRLAGTRIVMSNDGDLATLLGPQVVLYRQGTMVWQNPYGKFHPRFIPLMKSLVGDGTEFKGAAGFGEKAWESLVEQYGEYLGNLEDLVKRRKLTELEDDVADFKAFRRVIDSAEHVYESYECALLHDEWVNPTHNPLRIMLENLGEVEDYRLKKFTPAVGDWSDLLSLQHREYKHDPSRKPAVFDSEIIGVNNPCFLTCVEFIDTGERHSFWGHVPGDMFKLKAMFERDDVTFVSFNGMNFDLPINSMAVYESSEDSVLTLDTLKRLRFMTEAIIERNAKPWELEREFGYERLTFDHIDLCETAPGVKISLKAYAGRLAYPTMVDMPFDHTHEPSGDDFSVIENYCFNDLGVTKKLYNTLRTEIALRVDMGQRYDIDLRSRSDAQVAEAVLRKALGIKGKVERNIPRRVRYSPPAFIKTDSAIINAMIEKLTAHEFKINYANGSPEAPDFLEAPIQLGHGTYKMGIGGLHSTHDLRLFRKETRFRRISDFDVASYYPKIMLSAGIVPDFDGNKQLGLRFIETYKAIYDERVEAKRAKNKPVANSLKITLNGTFGKLGSPYSAFYDPTLMLGVTITGQLNLLCLIHELEKLPGVIVLSANTDGIMVSYSANQYQEVLAVFIENAKRTDFEYEETPYATVAMKDVNNYIAITAEHDAAIVSPDGTVAMIPTKAGVAKRKGLYASSRQEDNPLFLMKNPTMEVCSRMVIDYLRDGVVPEVAIDKYSDMRDFVAVRSVKGGGVQPESSCLIDDWVLVQDNGNASNLWMRQKHIDAGHTIDTGPHVKRKSRPAPVEEYVGGVPFGRLARWYMTTNMLPPVVYCGSGNKVPKTEGARVCMSLPDSLPADLDKGWYVAETKRILSDLGAVHADQTP